MVETHFIRPEACVTHSPACCSPSGAHPLAWLLLPSGEVCFLRNSWELRVPRDPIASLSRSRLTHRLSATGPSLELETKRQLGREGLGRGRALA